jgi:hypothetical protein
MPTYEEYGERNAMGQIFDFFSWFDRISLLLLGAFLEASGMHPTSQTIVF